jgi:cobalt-zinc-cadmium resistance protein CzcA
VIPIIFAAIFGILFLALGGIRQSIAVYSAIPLALGSGLIDSSIRCRLQ